MKIAVEPNAVSVFTDAVERGGGFVVPAAEADGLIWTDPSEPDRLAETLASSPVRWVQLPFAGIERFFNAGFIDAGRLWTCAKGAYGPATAEQALALMLTAARRLHEHARRQSWLTGSTENHRRLAGTTALIIGTGGIGESLAGMLRPLDVRILGVNRSGRTVSWAERTVAASSIDTLIPEADWLVLAAAHTKETTGMIDTGRLALMKPDAWIVNVARGPLVDTDALLAALSTGAIGGAGLDVTDPEPLPDDHPLWTLPNVIITSHTANTLWMAAPALATLIERNVRRFIAGEPLEGEIDPALGY